MRIIVMISILCLHYVIRPKWCIEKFKGTGDIEKCGFNENYFD